MLDELRTAHRRVIQAIDTAPDYRTYGPCHIPDCDGLIRGKAGDVLARCRTCYEPYDATELMRTAIVNSWDKPAPLVAVVRALNAAGVEVKYRTAQSWANRGKIAPDDHGHYTMSGILEIAQRQEAA